jgi:tetratricopeptide (TPR) repeat protein
MNTREKNAKGWQLYTFGDFRLLDRMGQPVRLSNRKVEALLAALTLHRQYGIERDSLAEILWPNRPLERQRPSLRQALSSLKKALGEDSLDASRSHVRLTSSLPIQCDYDELARQPNAVFMPGHEGEWFDEVRLETSHGQDDVPGNFPGRSVAKNFQESVEMLSNADPRGMFHLLRVNISLSRELPYPMFRLLLDRLDPYELGKGWSDFWRGTMADDLFESIGLLRSSMREAKWTQDYELASEACLELGRAYSRTGNLLKAEKMCEIAETLAGLVKTRAARANAVRLRGTHLMNWSNPKKGLLALQKAEEFTEDAVGRSHLIAVRALFSASVGNHRQAQDLLATIAKTSPILGISKQSRDHEITQIAVYAEELLGRIYDRSGDTRLSRLRFSSAQQGREKTQMILTPMEAKRLTCVR